MSRTTESTNSTISYRDVLTFGKHKGKIIDSKFVENNYNYLMWLQEKEIKVLSSILDRDVTYLYEKHIEEKYEDYWYSGWPDIF